MKSINEFASIWRDTVVTTPSLEIESERKVVVSKNVQINSAQISLEAPECKLKSLVQSENMSGNCFSLDRPIAKLRVSNKEVSVLEEVTFNANRSSDNIGIENYEFIINGEVSQSGTNPIFKKSFDSEGIYKVQLLVRDASGYIDSAVKRITVNNPLDSDMEAFFHYEVEDGELSLVYHQGLPIEDVVSMEYIINDSTEVNVSEFYHLTSTQIEGLSEGNHKVTLELVDINNVKYLFSRIVTVGPEEVMRQVLPVVDFDIYQVAPKKAFLDFRKSFEPYDGIEEVEIDWGDGTTSEVDAESFTSFFHTYSNVGEYEVTLFVNKEVGDDEWIQKEAIKTVVVTDSDVPSMPPIADFKADVEEFAPHVTFSSNFSVSPTSEIVSTVWDHGDGTSYSGSDKEHIHFYTPGVYLPSLTVVDSNGLISKLTMKVVVSEPGPPVISSIDCWNQDERWVECEIIAVDKEDEITELEINWGDGETEVFNMGQGERYLWTDRRHEYSQDGEYNISFIVRTNRGESATSSTQLSIEVEGEDVNIAPIASFWCDSYEVNKLSCDASSSFDEDGFITSYKVTTEVGEEIFYSPYFEVSFQEGGNKYIELEVMDNEGVTSSTDVTQWVQFNTLPEIVAECTADLLSISCSAVGTYDLDAQQLTYQWMVNGEVFGYDEDLSFNAPVKGQYSISLFVNDGLGRANWEKVLNISDDPSDLIEPFLSCVKQNSKEVYCSAHESVGNNLSFKWFVDGSETSVLTPYMKHNFSELGEHTITVNISNEYFSYDVSRTLELNYIPPSASFSYSLDENGDIELNAEESYINGRSVESFTWIIKDSGKEYKSVREIAKFKYEAINNKEVELRITDENDQVSSFTRLIDLSSENRPPKIVFSHIQEKGRASREVKFDLSDSSDPDGSIQSYGLIINGVDHNGSIQTVHFSESGRHSILAYIIDNNGKRVEDEYKVEIEDLEISGIPLDLMEMDFIRVFYKNYKSTSTPTIKIDGKDLIVANISERENSTIINYNLFEEGKSDYLIEISVDGLIYSKNIQIEELSLPSDPKYVFRKSLEGLFSAVRTVDPQSPELNSYVDEMNNIKDDIVNLLDQLADDEERKLAAHLISRSLNRTFKPLNKSDFITHRWIPHLIENSYASLFESEMINRATKCRSGLRGTAFVGKAIDGIGRAVSLISAVNIPLFFGPLHLKILAGTALYSIVIDKVLKITNYIFVKHYLKECNEKVFFPHIDSPDIELSLEGAEDGDVYGGASYKINLNVPAFNYSGYEDLGLQNNHELFNMIKSKVDEFNLGLLDGVGFMFADEYFARVSWSDRIISLLRLGGDTIFSYGLKNSVEDLLTSFSESTPVEETIVGDSGDYFGVMAPAFENLENRGSMITFSSNRETSFEFFHRLFMKNADNLSFISRKQEDAKVIGREYSYLPACVSENIRIHSNGGGIVSSNSFVEPQVYVGKKSKVCGASQVYGNVHIDGEVVINGAGTRINSYRNDNSIKKAHSENLEIRINGNVSIGSKNSENINISFGNIGDNEKKRIEIKNDGKGRIHIGNKSSYKMNDKFSEYSMGILSYLDGEDIRIENSKLLNLNIDSTINNDGVIISDSNLSNLDISNHESNVIESMIIKIEDSTIESDEIDSLTIFSPLKVIKSDLFFNDPDRSFGLSGVIENSRLENSEVAGSFVSGVDLKMIDTYDSQVLDISMEKNVNPLSSFSLLHSNVFGLGKDSSMVRGDFGIISYGGFIFFDGDNEVNRLTIRENPSAITFRKIDNSTINISRNKKSIVLDNIKDVSSFSISNNSEGVSVRKVTGMSDASLDGNKDSISLDVIELKDDLSIKGNAQEVIVNNGDFSSSMSIDGNNGKVKLDNVTSISGGAVTIRNSSNANFSQTTMGSVEVVVENLSVESGEMLNGAFFYRSVESQFLKSPHLKNGFSLNLSGSSLGENFTLDDSQLSGVANIGANSKIIDKSSVSGEINTGVNFTMNNSNVSSFLRARDRVTVIGSSISGDNVHIGNDVTVTSSILSNNANIVEDKSNRSCDGIDDNDEEDPCLKEP